MIRTLVVFSAVVCLCFTESPPELPEEFMRCYRDMMVYQVGDKYDRGCETCECTFDFDGIDLPKFECTKNTKCCLYSSGTGQNLRAFPGESYNDGCNSCRCNKRGKGLCG